MKKSKRTPRPLRRGPAPSTPRPAYRQDLMDIWQAISSYVGQTAVPTMQNLQGLQAVIAKNGWTREQVQEATKYVEAQLNKAEQHAT